MKKDTYYKISLVFLLALPVLYLLFPNNNPTTDAWGYAQNVKYGIELFRPHHLLYNWLLYLIHSLPLLKSIDTLLFMQWVNGLFTTLSLYFLYRILLALHRDKKKSLIWTLFVGCSFAALRYGTENETYIIPVFFSIIGSYFYLLYFQKREIQPEGKYLFLSGLFASLSCLFHQVHFFWWLALLLGIFLLPGQRRLREFFLFALPAWIVPIAYALVLSLHLATDLTFSNYLSFVFEYYYSDSADVEIGVLNFIMTPISLFRTFLQVHGNILNFFLARPIISSLSIACFIYCMCKVIFPLNFHFSFSRKNTFITIHVLAFLLHLAFAFFSKGNAEFMVMFPFLLAICLSYWVTNSEGKVLYLAIALLIWNMTFAVLPNHFYNLQNNEQLIKVIRSHPDQRFILMERNKIVAQYKYMYNSDIFDRVFTTDEIAENDEKGTFLTDVLSKQQPFSRASIVLDRSLDFEYHTEREVSDIRAFYGNYTVDEITVKGSVKR